MCPFIITQVIGIDAQIVSQHRVKEEDVSRTGIINAGIL
jgi:hypothetical protein